MLSRNVTKKPARRLCKEALEYETVFGNVDGSCDKLDEFMLRFCRKCTGGKFASKREKVE